MAFSAGVAANADRDAANIARVIDSVAFMVCLLGNCVGLGRGALAPHAGFSVDGAGVRYGETPVLTGPRVGAVSAAISRAQEGERILQGRTRHVDAIAQRRAILLGIDQDSTERTHGDVEHV